MESRKTRRDGYHDNDDDDETTKLLRTIPPGISARTHSISGTQSIIMELPEVYKSRWRSIRVMYLTMFLSSVSFSICMSSLYPYLKILDSTANTDFLGWVVAAYSVGQLVASPFFGAWSSIRSKTREPVIVSLFINVLANVLYMYLESIKTEPKIFLMLARVLVGFGAGNVAVVRSYVSGATTLSERTPAMANMSACQAVGFIIGPLIQTAMVPIGFPGVVHSVGLHLDMYTATAFFSAIVGVINILLLIIVFKEFTVRDDQFSPTNIQSSESMEATLDKDEVSRPDYYAVIPTILLFFSVLFIFAIFETIATPLSMHMFAWKKNEATLYIGIMLGGAGVVSIFVFAAVKVLSKRFNERYLLFGGFIMCFLGFVVYLPWGHHYPDIQYAAMDVPETTINSTEFDSLYYKSLQEMPVLNINKDTPIHSAYRAEMQQTHTDMENKFTVNTTMDIGGMPFKPTNVSNNSSKEAVGCPYHYDWCFYTPAISLWQFILGTFFVAVGYPVCNVMSYTIFSKILGPKPQGIWMGWLTAAGSLARTLGPVFVSQVYDAYGPRVTFIILLGIIFLTIVGLLVSFKKLVPFQSNTFNRSIIVENNS